jgi:hypothetical protein
MIDAHTKAAIQELYQQIDRLYKADKKRPTDMTCDICGMGDYQAKHAVLKVRTPVAGFEKREHLSPTLCFKHANGWAHSHSVFNPVGHKHSSEVDLHFARYLAMQLKKESRQ